MRMRFKPYAHDELMAADFHVHEPLIWGGKWHSQYARPELEEILEAEAAMPGLAALEAEAAENAERIRIRITDQVEFEG